MRHQNESHIAVRRHCREELFEGFQAPSRRTDSSDAEKRRRDFGTAKFSTRCLLGTENLFAWHSVPHLSLRRPNSEPPCPSSSRADRRDGTRKLESSASSPPL